MGRRGRLGCRSKNGPSDLLDVTLDAVVERDLIADAERVRDADEDTYGGGCVSSMRVERRCCSEWWVSRGAHFGCNPDATLPRGEREVVRAIDGVNLGSRTGDEVLERRLARETEHDRTTAAEREDALEREA